MASVDRLTATTLKGNWATLLLPINSDDSIDYSRLEAELDHFIGVGVNGIYSNGTAGEFHNQTETEFDSIQDLMAKKCHQAGMPFQIGASHPSPIISLERIKRTIDLKPSAFQVILPDWVVANPDEQISFLKKIEEAAEGIPLVLYNPPHAKSLLEPKQWAFIKRQIPGLIGMKLASGNQQWFEEMRKYASGLAVFVPGHLLATGVKEEVAAGAYSNIACLSPAGSQKWWQLITTDLNAALEIQERILKFFAECIMPYINASYSNPALDKFLAAVGGWSDIGTQLRWPYKWIPSAEVSAASKRAKELLPEFF